MKKPLYKYPSVWLIILFFGIMHYFTIFPYKKLEPLKGAIEYGKDTTFSIKSWLSEDYQHVKEKYINENFAFRSTFVRLHNQLQFSLFKVAFANGVIVGKDNYLYERNYIRAATGSDFIGKDSIHKKVEYMKRANRYLTCLSCWLPEKQVIFRSTFRIDSVKQDWQQITMYSEKNYWVQEFHSSILIPGFALKKIPVNILFFQKQVYTGVSTVLCLQ